MKNFLWIFMACFLTSASFAQGGNPFDLTPRLLTPDTPEDKSASNVFDTDTSAKAANPFDLTTTKIHHEDAESTPSPDKSLIVPTTEEEETISTAPSKNKNESQFLFFFLLFDLVLFSILMVSFRNIWQRVYRSIANDHMLSQFYSERYNNQIMLSVLALYSLFFVNMALFIFLLNKNVEWFTWENEISDSKQYFFIFLGVFLIMMLKHSVLRYIGYVFPLKMETGLYNFTIIVVAIFISLLLVPLNIGIAYIGQGATLPLIYITLIVLAALYLLRSLRGLFIANKLAKLYKSHFLLYLCTVEIAPLLILYRLFIRI